VGLLASGGMDYFIKPGYRCNERPAPYPDTEEDSATYQVDVYRYAADVAAARHARNLIDVGCGYGLKLARFLAPLGVDIVGIDSAHAIEFCRREHRFGSWYVDDLEAPKLRLERRFDLVISSDVIEHLIDPDNLLRYIRGVSHASTVIVLSTPERDLRRGSESMGPPQNPAHVREWNQAELAGYLGDRGFRVLEHRIVDLKAGMRTCQTLLCRLSPPADPAMRST